MRTLKQSKNINFLSNPTIFQDKLTHSKLCNWDYSQFVVSTSCLTCHVKQHWLDIRTVTNLFHLLRIPVPRKNPQHCIKMDNLRLTDATMSWPPNSWKNFKCSANIIRFWAYYCFGGAPYSLNNISKFNFKHAKNYKQMCHKQRNSHVSTRRAELAPFGAFRCAPPLRAIVLGTIIKILINNSFSSHLACFKNWIASFEIHLVTLPQFIKCGAPRLVVVCVFASESFGVCGLFSLCKSVLFSVIVNKFNVFFTPKRHWVAVRILNQDTSIFSRLQFSRQCVLAARVTRTQISARHLSSVFQINTIWHLLKNRFSASDKYVRTRNIKIY